MSISIKQNNAIRLLIVCGFFVFLGIARNPIKLNAQTAENIQQQIDAANLKKANIEKEIQSYQKQIDTLASQSVSLAATIKTLQLTRKKLEASISLTEDKIATKNYEIQKLGFQINGKTDNISDNQRIIAKSFLTMNEMDSQSLPELVLGSRSISQALDSFEQLGTLQQGLYDKIAKLNQDKRALETNKTASEKAKAELIKLNIQLSDQRSLVLSTAADQAAILKETNQSEATYKKILASKKVEAAAFQQEINSYESALNLIVNSSLLPKVAPGVLSWPLDTIRITQYFGNTPFSTANPQIYNFKGHTGVDFAASKGATVRAALNGTVVGEGDTDQYYGCSSFGKWIMIKHPNGLSTLYAHLSLQSVGTGEQVSAGQMIGYSGYSGYVYPPGPRGAHLHFGVYATQGVEIKKFDNSVNCKGATIPIADVKAYLNPLSYLPKI